MTEQRLNRAGPLSGLVFLVIFSVGLSWAAYMTFMNQFLSTTSVAVFVVTFLIASLIALSIKIADQWEKAIVLRLGKFYSLKGPGLFFIIPFVDVVAYWLDTRVITSSVNTERTLTKDTVPVNVDAVLFWKVTNPERAALNVADYEGAIGWASKTALRDVIGRTMLADMLEGRGKIGKELQRTIEERAEPWGINIVSVEIKDVLIPAALENAMSMQAQAERERQARIILGESEKQVAEKFEEAAKTYAENPVAFHLRAMNMLYEGLKQNSTIVVVPSSALDTMQLGAISGLTALAKQDKAEKEQAAVRRPGNANVNELQ